MEQLGTLSVKNVLMRKKALATIPTPRRIESLLLVCVVVSIMKSTNPYYNGCAAAILLVSTSFLTEGFAPPVGYAVTSSSSLSSSSFTSLGAPKPLTTSPSSASKWPPPRTSRATATNLQMILFPGKGGIIVEPPSDGFVARDVLLDEFLGRAPTTVKKPSQATFICTPSEDSNQDQSAAGGHGPDPARMNRVDPAEWQSPRPNYRGASPSGRHAPSEAASAANSENLASKFRNKPFRTPRPPSVPPPDVGWEQSQYDIVNSEDDYEISSAEVPNMPYENPTPGFPDPSEMRLREIQLELQSNNVDYSDCFDRESLVSRLIEFRMGHVPTASSRNDGRQNERAVDTASRQQPRYSGGYDSQPQHAWAQGTGNRTGYGNGQGGVFGEQHHRQPPRQRHGQEGREIGARGSSNRGGGPRRWWN